MKPFHSFIGSALLVLTLVTADSTRAADLSAVPQVHETKEQRDERMQWFRDAKPPWDINKHGPRASDPVDDNCHKNFNPTKHDAGEWVKFARAAFFPQRQAHPILRLVKQPARLPPVSDGSGRERVVEEEHQRAHGLQQHELSQKDSGRDCSDGP